MPSEARYTLRRVTIRETRRSVWLQVAALAAVFLGGGFAGARLSIALAPESLLAPFVGLFTFALPFIVGMHLWLGLAVIIAVWRLIRRVPDRAAITQIPSGSFVFVPTSLLIVTLAGVLVGILGSTLGFFATVALYALLGVLYGTACWQLASRGYLPFPAE